jgi:hypothetical protein
LGHVGIEAKVLHVLPCLDGANNHATRDFQKGASASAGHRKRESANVGAFVAEP